MQDTAHRTTGRLTGRVAIVTGAGHGMGAAITRRLTDEAARVVAVDINGEALAGFASNPDVETLTADLTVPSSATRAVTAAHDRFGRLDVLVNNAGIMDAFVPVAEVSDELWARVMAVNVTAPMMLMRAAIPRLLEAGGGVIVNISSIGGIAGGRAGAAYTASKHALVGLSRNTAANYGRDGVRCNVICPGAVETGMEVGGEPSGRGFATLNATLQANPRQAQPEELAALVAFLASAESSSMNGAVVVADGGWTAL